MSDGRRLPRTFRSLAALRGLNTIAVGASLAAGTAAVFDRGFLADTGTAICGSTFVYGAVWMMLLRWPATVGPTKLRWGWLASIPLAAANAGTACALGFEHHDVGYVMGFLLGATIGAICWVPALAATLVCFGLPIAHAQKLAKKGLAGEEVGEEVVGVVAVVIALAALALLFVVRRHDPLYDLPARETGLASVVAAGFACLGVCAGAFAAILAHLRGAARRRFVRAVEDGAVEGYRVDRSTGDKLIVQVNAAEEGYRVARIELPVCQLADDGEVVRSFPEERQIVRTT